MTLKVSVERPETLTVSNTATPAATPTTVDAGVTDPVSADAPRVCLQAHGGVVSVSNARTLADPAGAAPAQLTWPPAEIRVSLFGERVEGGTCRVAATAPLQVESVDTDARVVYDVSVARDRMSATLCVLLEPGTARRIADRPASPDLHLAVIETPIPAPAPTLAEATSAVQRAGVVHGVDADAIAAALESPGETVEIAVGTEPLRGRDGYLEPLVDFEELRLTGVLSGTPLVRRVRRKEGIAGRDVTGRELQVPGTKDAVLRAGEGTALDGRGVLATATIDGSPELSGEGVVLVRHELVVEAVDTISGDVEFHGSVHVRGDVCEGRSVSARHELVVEGNADRARLESGGSMEVQGTIMSSVLRAGGERAVAASIADRVLDLPRLLGIVAAQARQFRDQGAARGTDVSHGLSVQLVLERIHKTVLPSIASIVDDLREAGPTHATTAERAAGWHRLLATSANIGLTALQFSEILVEVGALVDDVRRAIEQPSDLVVSYMQASEAEATGTVTLAGKGIYNSRIVAWGGLHARGAEAVIRGGSVLSHGAITVPEVGSPAGARTTVQLGRGGSLEAERAYAGTVVSGPGYTHRFVADRATVRAGFDAGGTMTVESLAA